MKMDFIIEKNGIIVGIREEYDSGRVYGCYFAYRYGTHNQFVRQVERSRIPICSRKELEEYIENKTKILAKIWRLKPSKRKRK